MIWPFNLLGGRTKLSGGDANGRYYWSDSDGVGLRVNQSSVLSLSAAWACVRLRQRVIGSCPISLFSKDGANSRREDTDYWLYGLLHDSPNAEQTPYEFWSGMVGSLDLWGNGYAEKSFGAMGRVTALTPISSAAVSVRRNSDGERVYSFSDRGKAADLPEEKMFHLRGMNLGGDVGISAIAAGSRSMGAAMSADATAANLVSHGLQIAGFMETGESKLSPEQRRDLVKIFAEFTGTDLAGKIMPLEKNLKFSPLRMNPIEAQLLESRGWNVEEICRWFDTPPILVGHASSGQTMWGTGVEQIFLGWLATGLNPLFVSIEQAVRKQLVPAADRARMKPEFNREALLATDSAARAALFSVLAQNGLRTRNEMRAKDNMPPLPGGDQLTVQSNLVPLEKLGTLPPAKVQPAPGEPIED